MTRSGSPSALPVRHFRGPAVMAHEIARHLLQKAATVEERVEAIHAALGLGMGLREIEEYLDYLDALINDSHTGGDRAAPASSVPPTLTPPNGKNGGRSRPAASAPPGKGFVSHAFTRMSLT
jgi:hypothetical protein